MSRRRRHWEYAPIVLLGCLVAAGGGPAVCPDCYHEGYQIDLSLLPLNSTPPAAVLFSGYRNGRCEDDLICTASPDLVWLGDLGKATSYNWWNSCAGGREMVVFAAGHAPTPLHPAASDVPPLQPMLADRAILKLAAWVEPGPPAVAQNGASLTPIDAAKVELGKAQLIFDALGAGIKLDYTVQNLPPTIPTPVQDILDEATCSIAKTLMDGVSQGSMASMQDPARLNVYFVRNTHYAQDGLTCPGYKNQNPDVDRYVIFLARLHTPSTLAHEIGHALGLVLRAKLPDQSTGQDDGDVNELKLDPYLPTDNLMYSGVGNVGQITVGEIYRMHFDKRSWLWRGVAHTSDYPLECQPSPVEGGSCPPLTLHPTRGWP